MFNFIIYNYSNVFGGQERYVESLMIQFKKRNMLFKFKGGPKRLSQKKSNANEKFPSLNVEIINGNRALYLRAFRRSARTLRVYIQHSDILDCQDSFYKTWFRKIVHPLALSRMDIIVRVCEKALSSNFLGKKIHTIHNGVELPDLHSKSIFDRSFTLIMVGSVNINKNQILALELLLADKELKLLIVGDGPQRMQWEQWTIENGIGARVKWCGFVENPEHYYKNADTLLLLSEFEALPYALLEAMSFGLPVISTRVGGVPEVITHGHDGLLLPKRDLKSLRAAVTRLRLDSAFREKLGRNARATVAERFTVDQMTDKLISLVRSAARKKGMDF